MDDEELVYNALVHTYYRTGQMSKIQRLARPSALHSWGSSVNTIEQVKRTRCTALSSGTHPRSSSAPSVGRAAAGGNVDRRKRVDGSPSSDSSDSSEEPINDAAQFHPADALNKPKQEDPNPLDELRRAQLMVNRAMEMIKERRETDLKQLVNKLVKLDALDLVEDKEKRPKKAPKHEQEVDQFNKVKKKSKRRTKSQPAAHQQLRHVLHTKDGRTVGLECELLDEMGLDSVVEALLHDRLQQTAAMQRRWGAQNLLRACQQHEQGQHEHEHAVAAQQPQQVQQKVPAETECRCCCAQTGSATLFRQHPALSSTNETSSETTCTPSPVAAAPCAPAPDRMISANKHRLNNGHHDNQAHGRTGWHPASPLEFSDREDPAWTARKRQEERRQRRREKRMKRKRAAAVEAAQEEEEKRKARQMDRSEKKEDKVGKSAVRSPAQNVVIVHGVQVSALEHQRTNPGAGVGQRKHQQGQVQKTRQDSASEVTTTSPARPVAPPEPKTRSNGYLQFPLREDDSIFELTQHSEGATLSLTDCRSDMKLVEYGGSEDDIRSSEPLGKELKRNERDKVGSRLNQHDRAKLDELNGLRNKNNKDNDRNKAGKDRCDDHPDLSLLSNLRLVHRVQKEEHRRRREQSQQPVEVEIPLLQTLQPALLNNCTRNRGDLDKVGVKMCKLIASHVKINKVNKNNMKNNNPTPDLTSDGSNALHTDSNFSKSSARRAQPHSQDTTGWDESEGDRKVVDRAVHQKPAVDHPKANLHTIIPRVELTHSEQGAQLSFLLDVFDPNGQMAHHEVLCDLPGFQPERLSVNGKPFRRAPKP